jgi:hypothetical protein
MAYKENVPKACVKSPSVPFTAFRRALKECESCAVFVGPEGLEPWQTEEMRLAINRRVCDGETIPRHSGFAARGEARELAGVARKHCVGRIP